MKKGVYIKVLVDFCSCKIDIQYIHVHNLPNEEADEVIEQKIESE